MRRPERRRAGVVAALVPLLTLASGARASDPGEAFTGRFWLPDGNGQLEIRRIRDSVAGHIACFEDRVTQDERNPDEALRNRPIVGLEILTDFVWNERRGRWEDGSIYDPESGSTYRSRLSLDGEDLLQALGYVGVPMLGRTAVFERVPAAEIVEGQLCSQSD